jgi:hypothetical protein
MARTSGGSTRARTTCSRRFPLRHTRGAPRRRCVRVRVCVCVLCARSPPISIIYTCGGGGVAVAVAVAVAVGGVYYARVAPPISCARGTRVETPEGVVCPRTTLCVFAYCYISSVLILLTLSVSAYPHTTYSKCVRIPSYYLLYVCPHTACRCMCAQDKNVLSSLCVLILLYMCPHTPICVLSYCYICVLILLYVSSYYYITVCVSSYSILICICVLILLYVSAYSYIFVLILLYMCSHTPIYVSSYSYIRVLILLYVCPHMCPPDNNVLEPLDCAENIAQIYICGPHTAMCLSSYYYICVLILLYVCPHTTIYVSSYCYMCVLILPYVSSYY